MGSRFSVAAELTLADLLLFCDIKVSAFDPKAALGGSGGGAAGGLGEHRLVVRYLQLLQLLIDLLQVTDSRRLSLHVSQVGAQAQDGLQALALLQTGESE